MATNNQDQSRSFRIFGQRLRNQRLRAGLTQSQLAEKAGYTDRLIRKAEANGRLNCQSLSDIVTALQESGADVCESDLTFDPVEIAAEFVTAYEQHGRAMLDHCGHLLSEAFTFESAGDPETSPIAGVFLGVGGFQEWLDRFLGQFERVADKPLNPEYFANVNQIVARYTENVVFNGVSCPPIWVNLYFKIEDGQIVYVRDEYDTLTVSKVLVACGV